ncbi:hypothetical protein [Mesorhizobium jarvisii]|uniref:hypothetical protein n=1 Tax=Mesorhizobium jarvisii TaxID=1777867 RepID=UPI0005718CEF|nr:hypothetical protein [Mesorhizobium jarvisii]MCH4561020.1 hypothetical protein [Mesorhizobium jarvisii]QGU20766.1 hypothetical protein MCHK_09640 [Mesorhizobium huakuii 7653R]
MSGLRLNWTYALDPDDFPQRETALAILGALQRIEEGTPSELDRLTGIDNASTVSDRCYMVYGYPELEPVARLRHMAEVYMRPRKAPVPDSKTQQETPRASPKSIPQDAYGFTRRET